jgi:hypothetical protein
LVVQLGDPSRGALLLLELGLQCSVFPLSWLMVPFLLAGWLITSHSEVGKMFLLINYAAVLNTTLLFALGGLQLLLGLTEDTHDP